MSSDDILKNRAKVYKGEPNELTPVTYAILDLIAKTENLSIEKLGELLSENKPQQLNDSIATTVFILVYLNLQNNLQKRHAFQTALQIMRDTNDKIAALLKQVFIDDSISITSLKEQIDNFEIDDIQDLEEFLQSVISNSYSGKH